MSGFGHLPSLVQPFYANGNINDYLASHPEADSLYMVGLIPLFLTSLLHSE